MIIEPNYGLKCHGGYKILPEDVLAITLFGHIFFRMTDEELETYASTRAGILTMHHEFIHTLQGKSFILGYLTFYILYVFYYITNLFRYEFDTSKAYFNIPFEREAYAMEYDLDYRTTDWKKYIG